MIDRNRIKKYPKPNGNILFQYNYRPKGKNNIPIRLVMPKDTSIKEIQVLLNIKLEGILKELVNPVPVISKTMTVQDLAIAWITHVETTLEHSTADKYDKCVFNYINPYLGNLTLKSLNGDHIHRMIEDLNNRDKNAPTLNNTLKDVNTMINFGIKQNWLRSNPIHLKTKDLVRDLNKKRSKNLKMSEIPYLSTDVVEEYINRVRQYDETNDTNYQVIAMLEAYQGLRVSETFGVHYEDIDFTNNNLSIKRQTQKQSRLRNAPTTAEIGTIEKEMKSGASVRTIPLNRWVRQWLENNANGQTGNIVRKLNGGLMDLEMYEHKCFLPIRRQMIEDGWIKEAKDFVTHSLRKYYGSYLLEKNVSLVKVSKLMGHSSPRITAEVYAKLIDGFEDIPDVGPIPNKTNSIDKFLEDVVKAIPETTSSN